MAPREGRPGAGHSVRTEIKAAVSRRVRIKALRSASDQDRNNDDPSSVRSHRPLHTEYATSPAKAFDSWSLPSPPRKLRVMSRVQLSETCGARSCAPASPATLDRICVIAERLALGRERFDSRRKSGGVDLCRRCSSGSRQPRHGWSAIPRKTDTDPQKTALMRMLQTEQTLQHAMRMRATFFAIGALLTVLAGAGCKSSKCFPDCVAGYEPVPNACTCRPVADAATDGTSSDVAGDSNSADGARDGGPLASCVPGSACGSGASCIEGCPASAKPSIGSVGGICSVPGRDTCGCGVALDPCTTPGTACLMPACCDYEGICVTPAERAAICARPEGAHFDCTAVDAGVSPTDATSSDGGDAPADLAPGGCAAGTEFCNSACGICILAGGPCDIDTCGNGDGGEPCAGGRCGTATQCVGQICVPAQ